MTIVFQKSPSNTITIRSLVWCLGEWLFGKNFCLFADQFAKNKCVIHCVYGAQFFTFISKGVSNDKKFCC